jgi:hypothetical protein
MGAAGILPALASLDGSAKGRRDACPPLGATGGVSLSLRSPKRRFPESAIVPTDPERHPGQRWMRFPWARQRAVRCPRARLAFAGPGKKAARELDRRELGRIACKGVRAVQRENRSPSGMSASAKASVLGVP